MSFFISDYHEKVDISGYDPASQPFITQTNVVRTSETQSRFEGRFFYGLNNEFWQSAANVGGSRIYLPDQNGVEIRSGLTAGTKYVDITKTIFFYQPDTVVHAASAIAFDTNPESRQFWGMAQWIGGEIVNGFTLEANGSSVEFCKYSNASGSVVKTSIPQSQWLDPMNGRGASRIEIDFNSIQMAEINYAWYGAGTANLLFRINNKSYLAASFQGANNGTRLPIIGNPNLSVLYGVETLTDTATAPSFIHWGLSVSVDGGKRETGKPFSTTVNPKTVSGGTLAPIISIRLKQLFSIDGADPQPNIQGYITDCILSIYSSGRDSEIVLIRNATIATPSWGSIRDVVNNPIADSMVEVDTAATSITAGIPVYPRKLAGNSSLEISVIAQDLIAVDSLDQGSTILTVAAKPTAGGTADIAAAFSWREVY